MKAMLTDKELVVLELFAEGHSARTAAKVLWISESAVKARAHSFKCKLRAKTMPHAVSIAYQERILKIKNDENLL